MNNGKVKVELTREQAEELSSFLSRRCGEIQAAAVSPNYPKDKGDQDELNAVFSETLAISKAVATAMGYEAYCDPDCVLLDFDLEDLLDKPA